MNSTTKVELDLTPQTWSEQQREILAQAEHLRILFRHSIFLFMGNLAGTLTLLVGLWSTANHVQLIAWSIGMLMLNFSRWFFASKFPSGMISKNETKQWDKRYVIAVGISGIMWGLCSALFYVEGQTEHNLFLSQLILAMCAASTVSLSYHRIAYPVFLVPAITPLVVHLFQDVNLLASTVGYVIPFYFLLLYLLSREIYYTAHESILGRINSQYQAMFDYLTGIANRRSFEETLNREWYRAIRDKSELSLIIADIDNFKLCNDTYGHATGDLVLKEVAKMFENRIRRGADLVARIGGEEFAVILPETDLEGAVALAENIRAGVRELADKTILDVPNVTMSFGVASMQPDQSISPELLFKHADDSAYQAKREGKDKVVSDFDSC